MQLPSAVQAPAIFLAVIVTALALSSASGSAQTPADARLSSHLQSLLETGVTASADGVIPADPELQSMTEVGLLRFDDAGRVEVILRTDDIAATIASVGALGGRFQAADPKGGSVQARVPVTAIPDLVKLPSVRYLSEPVYGIVNRGSATTEAYSLFQMDLLRSAYGMDGRGVRVGVISDGVGGIADAQASGDLPDDVNIDTCNVVHGADPHASGVEGTALLEVVHDMAPQAELWFGNYAFGSYLYFNDAVDCLAQNVDVIVDDISWFLLGPYDGSSPVSANATRALTSDATRVRAYVSAAGNYARRHWAAPFTPCPDSPPDGASARQSFATGSGTIDRFDLGPRCNNPTSVAPGGTVIGFLQWDDTFGASCNDYDLYILVHDSADVLASSTNTQTCGQDPAEVTSWHNDSADTSTVDLVIERKGFPAVPVRFDLFIAGGVPNFYSPAGSVGSAADAKGVIAAGAIDVNDPGLDDVEPYSSLGPAADGRVKPDIIAPDCVSVTGAGGFGIPFCGTSAAAPHVAAVAALLLGCHKALLAGEKNDDPRDDRKALSDALLKTATERDPIGRDNTYGYGIINPLAAAKVGCKPSETIFGNINCDIRVDTIDGLFLLRHVASIPPDALCLNAADVNCSGRADAVDGLGILRFAAGLPPLPVPVNCPPIGVVPGTR